MRGDQRVSPDHRAAQISADGSILVWGIPGNGDNTFDTVEVATVA